jgi:hypothetical protein
MPLGKRFAVVAQRLYTPVLLLRQLILLEMQTNYMRCLWYNPKCQAVRLPSLSSQLNPLKIRSLEEQKNSEVSLSPSAMVPYPLRQLPFFVTSLLYFSCLSFFSCLRLLFITH